MMCLEWVWVPQAQGWVQAWRRLPGLQVAVALVAAPGLVS
jgi:hypothetical protein